MAQVSYTVCKSRDNHVSRIIELAIQHYLTDEAIVQNYYRALSHEQKGRFSSHFGRMLQTILHENNVYVAIEAETAVVVGFVVLLGRKYQTSRGFIEDTADGTLENLNQIMKFLGQIRRDVYPDGHLSIVTPIQLAYLTVEDCHRRKGVASLLLKTAIAKAKESGATLIYGIFTSTITKDLANRVGFWCKYQVRLYSKTTDSRVLRLSEYDLTAPDHVISVMAVNQDSS